MLLLFFRYFYYFMFGCLFFFILALLLCLCVNVLHGFYLFTNFNKSSGSTFFQCHANIDKDAACLQSNFTDTCEDIQS